MKDELTLQEKLTFLQREAKDEQFRIDEGFDILDIFNTDSAKWEEIDDDYFNSKVLLWLIKNWSESTGDRSDDGRILHVGASFAEYEHDFDVAPIVRLSDKMAGKE